MRSTIISAFFAAAAVIAPAAAQTSTLCNPLSQTCKSDTALGRSVTVDFTKGASSEFSMGNGAASYDSNGANLVVAKSGDSPLLVSNWYMMFGHVEVTMKAAPGVGIVSSMVLISDDLDEIDFEWLGYQNGQVQSNWFGQGVTGSYNRGGTHANPGDQSEFITYAMDFTAEQIRWYIGGNLVRTLTPADARALGYTYPQTPMQLKLGIWSGGDAGNQPGVIAWAGGNTNYAAGPYAMVVKSVTARDYSTGAQYTYSDMSGTYGSIKASGGSTNSGTSISPVVSNNPSVTTVSGNPDPTGTGFGGTHKTDSTITTTGWPWVSSALPSASTLSTSYPPSVPSSWTVSTSGTAVTLPSAASTSPSCTSCSSPDSSSCGSDVHTTVIDVTETVTVPCTSAISTGTDSSVVYSTFTTLSTITTASVITSEPSAGPTGSSNRTATLSAPTSTGIVTGGASKVAGTGFALGVAVVGALLYI